MNNYASAQVVARGRTLGASLLIAGTCVGGGMLALPVETGAAGLFPSLFAMLAAWAFMTFTGLLYVEASLWMPEGGHVMSMASQLLGKAGKIFASLLYLFMGYASLIAYTSGGAGIIDNFFLAYGGIHLSKIQCALLFTLLFGFLIYLGTRSVSRVNALLIIGMVLAYVFLIGMGFSEVQSAHFQRLDWARSCFSLPLLLCSFSYQMVVPSLTSYLNRDAFALRKAVILGTTLPFIAYGLWQTIILGCVPFEGEHGLSGAFARGESATVSLMAIVTNPWLIICAEYFAFFALITSYLGIGLGLFDFLADMLKGKDPATGRKRGLVGLLVVIPTLIFALLCPRAFLTSLEISGGFGDTLLNGCIPVAMIWIGRYVHSIQAPYRVFGGKKSLILALSFALFVLGMQCIKLFW